MYAKSKYSRQGHPTNEGQPNCPVKASSCLYWAAAIEEDTRVRFNVNDKDTDSYAQEKTMLNYSCIFLPKMDRKYKMINNIILDDGPFRSDDIQYVQDDFWNNNGLYHMSRLKPLECLIPDVPRQKKKI